MFYKTSLIFLSILRQAALIMAKKSSADKSTQSARFRENDRDETINS